MQTLDFVVLVFLTLYVITAGFLAARMRRRSTGRLIGAARLKSFTPAFIPEKARS